MSKENCNKKDCKNKSSLNCVGCRHNSNIPKSDKLWDSYSNKYKFS